MGIFLYYFNLASHYLFHFFALVFLPAPPPEKIFRACRDYNFVYKRKGRRKLRRPLCFFNRFISPFYFCRLTGMTKAASATPSSSESAPSLSSTTSGTPRRYIIALFASSITILTVIASDDV